MYSTQEKIQIITQELTRSIQTMKMVMLETNIDKDAFEHLSLRVINQEALLNSLQENDKLAALLEEKRHSVSRTALPCGEVLPHPTGMKVVSRVNKNPTYGTIADKIEGLKQKLLTA